MSQNQKTYEAESLGKKKSNPLTSARIHNDRLPSDEFYLSTFDRKSIKFQGSPIMEQLLPFRVYS